MRAHFHKYKLWHKGGRCEAPRRRSLELLRRGVFLFESPQNRIESLNLSRSVVHETAQPLVNTRKRTPKSVLFLSEKWHKNFRKVTYFAKTPQKWPYNSIFQLFRLVNMDLRNATYFAYVSRKPCTVTAGSLFRKVCYFAKTDVTKN